MKNRIQLIVVLVTIIFSNKVNAQREMDLEFTNGVAIKNVGQTKVLPYDGFFAEGKMYVVAKTRPTNPLIRIGTPLLFFFNGTSAEIGNFILEIDTNKSEIKNTYRVNSKLDNKKGNRLIKTIYNDGNAYLFRYYSTNKDVYMFVDKFNLKNKTTETTKIFGCGKKEFSFLEVRENADKNSFTIAACIIVKDDKPYLQYASMDFDYNIIKKGTNIKIPTNEKYSIADFSVTTKNNIIIITRDFEKSKSWISTKTTNNYNCFVIKDSTAYKVKLEGNKQLKKIQLIETKEATKLFFVGANNSLNLMDVNEDAIAAGDSTQPFINKFESSFKDIIVDGANTTVPDEIETRRSRNKRQKEDKQILDNPDYDGSIEITNVNVLEDNSIMLLAEKFEHEFYTTWDNRGRSRTTHYFRYGPGALLLLDNTNKLDNYAKLDYYRSYANYNPGRGFYYQTLGDNSIVAKGQGNKYYNLKLNKNTIEGGDRKRLFFTFKNKDFGGLQNGIGTIKIENRQFMYKQKSGKLMVGKFVK